MRDWITYTPPKSTVSRRIPVWLPAASGSDLEAGEGAPMLAAGQISFDVTAEDMAVGGGIEWRRRNYRIDTVGPVADARHVFYRITASTRR